VSADPRRLARDPSPDAGWARPAPRPAGARLEVVPDGAWRRRRRRLRRRLLALTGLGLALVPVFGLVLVHVELTTSEDRLTSLQHRVDTAQQANVQLRLQVAQLTAPSRIVNRAQALGMVPPPSVLYVTGVPDGATAVTAPQATPATTPASSVAGLAATKRADRTP
jgi:cell division protein FtsL